MAGFAGGVAEGLLAGRGLRLQQRALALQEKTAQDDVNRDLATRTDKAITGTMDLITKTIQGVKDTSGIGGTIKDYREAIASIESAGSGGYQAIGPQTDSGERAYGRYQVMESNIGPWTQEVLGRAMSPQEFLASSAAQDAVFDAKFGQYVSQTGNAADAASMWFTGRPLSQGAGASDVNGVSGIEYVSKFQKALVDVPRNKMRAAVEPLLADVEQLAQLSGRDPKSYRNMVEATITATPTQVQDAINAGQTAAQTKVAEADALMRAGVQRADALATAGIKASAGEGTGLLDARQILDVEEGMRKEYTNLSKTFLDVQDAFGRVEQGAQNPSAAGDIAMVFNYMKMLDPASTVREGEFATAQNATGIPGRISNMYNQILSGARLNDEQRADFLAQARGFFTLQQKQHIKLTDQFRTIAGRAGVNPENVVVDFGRAEPAAGDNDPWGVR